MEKDHEREVQNLQKRKGVEKRETVSEEAKRVAGRHMPSKP